MQPVLEEIDRALEMLIFLSSDSNGSPTGRSFISRKLNFY